MAAQDSWDEYSTDEDEDGEDCFAFSEEDCGRWNNGALGYQCRLVGSEDCDWECPIGLPSRRREAA